MRHDDSELIWEQYQQSLHERGGAIGAVGAAAGGTLRGVGSAAQGVGNAAHGVGSAVQGVGTGVSTVGQGMANRQNRNKQIKDTKAQHKHLKIQNKHAANQAGQQQQIMQLVKKLPPELKQKLAASKGDDIQLMNAVVQNQKSGFLGMGGNDLSELSKLIKIPQNLQTLKQIL